MKAYLSIAALITALTSTSVSAIPKFNYNWTRQCDDYKCVVRLKTSLRDRYRLRCTYWKSGKRLHSMDVFVRPAKTSRMQVSNRVGSQFTKLHCKG